MVNLLHTLRQLKDVAMDTRVNPNVFADGIGCTPIPMMSTPNMMLRYFDEEENEQFAWVGYRRQGTVTTSNAPYNWEIDVITSTAPGNENSNCDWFEVDYASGGFQWETVDLLPAIIGFPTQGRTVLYYGKYKMVSNPCDGSFD